MIDFPKKMKILSSGKLKSKRVNEDRRIGIEPEKRPLGAARREPERRASLSLVVFEVA